ncbi:MAG: TonB-dependent receptor, partial [Gammaproteobacteria bacterium]|nr:TonB-dependent receptor [Gammaproteobacteria bacterium]
MQNPVCRLFLQALIFLISSYSLPATTAEHDELTQTQQINGLNEEYVSYPVEYFARFHPVTALDMVMEIPGFQLEEDAEDMRGFSETAGNVLINDRRPSAKQDSLSSILSRISADSVERVELIRGQVRAIDMRGEPLVVNIVLRKDNPAVVQWEAELERRFNYGNVAPSGLISLSDKWRDMEFNIGIEGRHEPAGRTGVDRIFDNNGNIAENRFDRREIRNHYVKGNFNTAKLMGQSLVQFNSSIQYDFDYVTLESRRVPTGSQIATRNDFVRNDEDILTVEAGLDLERELPLNVTGKLIVLYGNSRADILSAQQITNMTNIQTLERIADSTIKSTETITRLEFDWGGSSVHLLQLNMERAFNTLDSQLQQTDDAGAG